MKRTRDGLAHKFASAGVRRMTFHQHRTTGGKCRSGIAARNRKREREIAGTEDYYRTDRLVQIAQIRARQGRTGA